MKKIEIEADEVKECHCNRIAVRYDKYKWNYFDMNHEQIIGCEPYYTYASDYENNIAMVQLRNGNYCIINADGEQISVESTYEIINLLFKKSVLTGKISIRRYKNQKRKTKIIKK